jgi:hypothetical protein
MSWGGSCGEDTCQELGHLSPMGGGRFVRGGVAGLDELSLCQSPLSSPPLPGGYVVAMLSWG